MSNEKTTLDYSSTMLIACATVIEEMLPFMPVELNYKTLEFGLHKDPDKLHLVLQETIDAIAPRMTTILLGFGLCSKATVGLKSMTGSLIIPKIDDCIGIFLGSRSQYLEQQRTQPGTIYQTKGWIEAEKSTNLKAYTIRKYGEKRAAFFLKQMYKNYTRLAFINTGNYQIEQYRAASAARAAELGLQYCEIPGANTLVKKLLFGPWDNDFVIAHRADYRFYGFSVLIVLADI